MKLTEGYSYSHSTKSEVSDELINTYLLRPLAGVLVRLLYRTPITPNHVTIAATLTGMIAGILYSYGSPALTFAAGLSITLKDLLDSADGQLARARNMYSRTGRFLDSIGDFVVNLLVFAAIAVALTNEIGDYHLPVLCLLCFWGTTLRVSYHVFYQTAFLHLQDAYKTNRLTEEVRAEDLLAGRSTLLLQRIYGVLYNWQDRMMEKIDTWCRKGFPRSRANDVYWYSDNTGLRLSGFLGMGTELFLLMVCSVTDSLPLYLYLNLFLMNTIWLGSVLYRKVVLANRHR